MAAGDPVLEGKAGQGLWVSGLIGLWTGTIANIPSGFVICDGNNGTSNLLARFVEGVATAATNPGTIGGESTHTLSVAEMPSHTHIISDTTTNVTTGGAGPKPGSNGAVSSASAGSSSAHENKPPFYDVAFLMKT